VKYTSIDWNIKKTWRDRISFTIAGMLSRFSVPASTLATSFIIIRRYNADIWGGFVIYSLAATLILTIAAFGSSEYLQKKFAVKPKHIPSIWLGNVLLRLAVLSLFIILLFAVPFQIPFKPPLLAFLVVALFVNKCVDPLIQYRRAYHLNTIVELAGFTALCIIILYNPAVSTEALVSFFSIICLAKGICLIIVLTKKGTFEHVSLNLIELKESFPFFLPSIIGLLQSRIDMYLVGAMLSRKDLATYHIFIAWLSIVHQIALTLVNPYVKNLYRLPDRSIEAAAQKFFFAGIVISISATPIVFLILEYYYEISLDLVQYLLGACILMPLFYYSVKTYGWFKNNRQYSAALVNAIMVLMTAACGVLMIPQWGITGGLISSALSQWVAFLIFRFAFHKS
jgi:O-antigen/teichoic acid export membrane protein